MSAFYVTVFPDANQTALGDIEQALSIATLSTSNQQTAAVTQNSTTKMKRVRMFSEVACWVAYGTSPDATGTARMPLGAENPEYLTVPLGTKFAAITR